MCVLLRANVVSETMEHSALPKNFYYRHYFFSVSEPSFLGLALVDLPEDSETFLAACLSAKETLFFGLHRSLVHLTFHYFLMEKGILWLTAIGNIRLCLEIGVQLQDLSPFLHLTAFLGISFTLRQPCPSWKDGVLAFCYLRSSLSLAQFPIQPPFLLNCSLLPKQAFIYSTSIDFLLYILIDGQTIIQHNW